MEGMQFSEEQIIGILKEAETGAVVTELCRKHGMSNATYYAWKAKYGGLEVSEAKGLRALEDENAKLKRPLAGTMLDNPGLKDLLSKSGDARCAARSRRASLHQAAGGDLSSNQQFVVDQLTSQTGALKPTDCGTKMWD